MAASVLQILSEKVLCLHGAPKAGPGWALEAEGHQELLPLRLLNVGRHLLLGCKVVGVCSALVPGNLSEPKTDVRPE